MSPALSPGRVLSPADVLLTFHPWAADAPGFHPRGTLLASDVIWLFHPWLVYAAGEIAAGRFPLWNPHAFAGAPFFANPQSALLFPLNALAYLLPIGTAIGLIAVGKLATAGLGTYWLLRELTLTRLAAGLGAVAFMLSSAMLAWLHWSMASVLAVLPLSFAVTERLRRRPTARRVAALALTIALLLLAGYPQSAMQAGLVLGAWVLWQARGAPRPGAFVAAFVVGGVLGVLLAAVQLLPFLEYARESAVLAHRDEGYPFQSLPVRAALTLLMPFYYGLPGDADFWGYMNFKESTISIGIVPLLAVPVAVLCTWRRSQTPYWCAAAALMAAVTFGVPGAIRYVAAMPPLSYTLTIRFLPILLFAVCVLCALGIDAAQTVPPERRAATRRAVQAAFVGVSGAGLTVVLYDFPILVRQTTTILPQYLFALLLLCLGAVALLRIVDGGPRAPAWAATLVGIEFVSLLPLALVASPVIDHRHFYPPPPPALQHARQLSSRDHSRVTFTTMLNVGMLYGLSDAVGYDGMTPRRIAHLVGPREPVPQNGSGPLRFASGHDSRAADILAVARVVSGPGARPPAPHFVLEYDGADGRVFRNLRALPRAFVARWARTCVDDAVAASALHDDGFDARREVLIADCDAPPVNGAARQAEATIVEATAHRVVARAQTDASAYLVLADTWFPGWRARVDGAEQPIRRAHLAVRAVWLPPGRHEVVFSYEPASFHYGLLASAASAAITVGLGLAPALGRHRRP